jgi:hypothetical protein
MTKDKLQIGTDILKASLCEKEGAFYYWEGSAENSTVVVSSADMTKIDLAYTNYLAKEPLDQCKEEAKKRIATTDWAVLPDVGLSNVAAFQTYRAALRELIKNPVAEPTWPTEPEPIWS